MTSDFFRDLDLNDVLDSAIYRAVVHVDDLVALGAIGLFDGLFDGLDRIVLADDAGDRKEGGLHDHVDARTQAKSQAQFDRIDDVEFNFFLNQLFLHQGRQAVPDLIFGVAGGQEEGSATFQVRQHVIGIEKSRIVTGDEVGFVDQVRGNDLVLAETQMRDGHGTGFFGIVNKVALSGVVGFRTNDFDGVLVGANRAVGTEAVKQRPIHIGTFNVEGLVIFEAGESDIVIRADAEFFLRRK